MKKTLFIIFILILVFSSAFSINWKWELHGKEFLLLSPNGKSYELGYRIRSQWLPVKLYTNNNDFLFFVGDDYVLRAFELRASGSLICNNHYKLELDTEWGRIRGINPYADKSTNEIGIRFYGGKTRVFAVDKENGVINKVREEY